MEAKVLLIYILILCWITLKTSVAGNESIKLTKKKSMPVVEGYPEVNRMLNIHDNDHSIDKKAFEESDIEQDGLKKTDFHQQVIPIPNMKTMAVQTSSIVVETAMKLFPTERISSVDCSQSLFQRDKSLSEVNVFEANIVEHGNMSEVISPTFSSVLQQFHWPITSTKEYISAYATTRELRHSVSVQSKYSRPRRYREQYSNTSESFHSVQQVANESSVASNLISTFHDNRNISSALSFQHKTIGTLSPSFSDNQISSATVFTKDKVMHRSLRSSHAFNNPKVSTAENTINLEEPFSMTNNPLSTYGTNFDETSTFMKTVRESTRQLETSFEALTESLKTGSYSVALNRHLYVHESQIQPKYDDLGTNDFKGLNVAATSDLSHSFSVETNTIHSVTPTERKSNYLNTFVGSTDPLNFSSTSLPYRSSEYITVEVTKMSPLKHTEFINHISTTLTTIPSKYPTVYDETLSSTINSEMFTKFIDVLWRKDINILNVDFDKYDKEYKKHDMKRKTNLKKKIDPDVKSVDSRIVSTTQIMSSMSVTTYQLESSDTTTPDLYSHQSADSSVWTGVSVSETVLSTAFNLRRDVLPHEESVKTTYIAIHHSVDENSSMSLLHPTMSYDSTMKSTVIEPLSHIENMITSPTIYISVLLRCDWKLFCLHKKSFQEEVAHIMKHVAGIPLSYDRVRLFHLHMCRSPLQLFHSHKKITVFFYIREDVDDKSSKSLTHTCAKILLNIESLPSLMFASKILEVHEYCKKPCIDSPESEKLSSTDKSYTDMIAVSIIATIGTISMIIIFMLMIILRNRKKVRTSNQAMSPTFDSHSLDTLSFRSIRSSFNTKRQYRSRRSYRNFAFSDPDAPSQLLNFAALTSYSTKEDLLKEQFETIVMVIARRNEVPPGVETKNRYANVLPLPETRVSLSMQPGIPNSDYINANFVRGYRNEMNVYIACQAPIESTIDDFWRMIWEQQSNVIVMMTLIEEYGLNKCAPYFPDSDTMDCYRCFDSFQVSLVHRDVREKYVISTLQLRNIQDNLMREVYHFWYTAWPSTGVPDEVYGIVSFVQECQPFMRKNPGGNVVHCSPGTGRTGVFICIDICMQHYIETRFIDILNTVYRLRHDRSGAVNTKEQYIFIYQALAEFTERQMSPSQRPSLKSEL
ncbi:Uncharacterised protein g7150 [Pycnogonum litorale]